MIYKFNQESLNYQKITGKLLLYVVTGIIVFIGIVLLIVLTRVNDIMLISTETKTIILNEHNEFSKAKLKEYIFDLNIKYPHIVMAQAEIETGNFTSKIFIENSNCFGMKQATRRPTTNKGTENNHAIYDTWRESVLDYAMFSAKYCGDLKSERDYLDFLGQYYAEDTNYVAKIKEKLKLIQ